ncbi:MAG TPA: hypothetical protein VF221_01015 [Chloroflexota bacterium]
MKALLRFYPADWRERYGVELEALLEEHPTTLRDVLDLIRGAVDARLHFRQRAANRDTDGSGADIDTAGSRSLDGSVASGRSVVPDVRPPYLDRLVTPDPTRPPTRGGPVG